jgi:hypothetical protein
MEDAINDQGWNETKLYLVCGACLPAWISTAILRASLRQKSTNTT